MGDLLECISVAESALAERWLQDPGCSDLSSWFVPSPFPAVLSPMPVPCSSLGCSFGIVVQASYFPFGLTLSVEWCSS